VVAADIANERAVAAYNRGVDALRALEPVAARREFTSARELAADQELREAAAEQVSSLASLDHYLEAMAALRRNDLRAAERGFTLARDGAADDSLQALATRRLEELGRSRPNPPRP
jgi:hypothetical protein